MAPSLRDAREPSPLLSSGLFAFGAASVAALAFSSAVSLPTLLGGACVGVLVSGWMVGMTLPAMADAEEGERLLLASSAGDTKSPVGLHDQTASMRGTRPSSGTDDLGDAVVAHRVESTDVTARPLQTPNVAPERSDTLRVLLAEDGRDNQMLICAQLGRAGMDVTIAENGEIAFELAMREACKGTPFDVVLMDMQMPLLDGYGAATKLRAAGYARPIVAVTAHAMAGDRERCLAAGCSEYLTKPIDRVKLIHTICVLSDQHQEADEGELVAELDDEDEEMAEVVEMFVADLVVRMTDIHAALKRGDHLKVRSLAHQLKGAGGGYGFPRISSAADAVERATWIPGNGVAIARAVDELGALCERARPLSGVS